MKRILNLLFILVTLTIFLVACGKDKGQEANQNNQPPIVDEYKMMLYATDARFNASGDLVVVFTNELDKNQDLKQLVTVEGLAEEPTILTFTNKIVIKGKFEKEVPYSVKVSKEIKDIDGGNLPEDFEKFNLYVGVKQPSLSFADYGMVLPSVNNKKINFNSLNVKKVKLDIYKVYTNNITQYLKATNYSPEWVIKEDIGDLVYTKEYPIESAKDEVVKNSIDLNGVIDNKGIYYVILSAPGQESIDYDIVKYGEPTPFYDNQTPLYAKATKTIILSDIGIIANSNNSKLDVKLLNLNTLEPISNAKLEFISKKNQTLEDGTTNSSGQYQSKIKLDDVYYILVKNGTEFNILYLADSKINYSDFDIGGSVEIGDTKLYTFTDKGFYRPGDEINISLIARSNKEKIKDNQPFEFSFIAPDGSTKISNQVVQESKNAFYNFKIQTDVNDMTGAWNLKIKFGGKEINQKVFIEAKLANKIAIDADEDKIYSKADVKDGKITFPIKFSYLNGAKVEKDTQVTFDYSIIEKPVITKQYKNYIFNNPTENNYQYRDLAQTKIADDSATINFNLDLNKALENKNYYLTMTVNALENTGRYSTENKTFQVVNRENSVGVQKLSQTENEASIKYIVLNEKTDKLVAGKKLKYRIYNKEFNWWYDSYGDDEQSFKQNIETSLMEEGDLISGDEPKEFKTSKLGDGMNFIEIIDEETGDSAGVFVYNYHYGDKRHGSIENLKIEADKEKYNIGDIAKIKYTGAVGTKALITIEKDGKIIKEYWKSLSAINNEEAVKIEKEYFPNAYVSISVFQKYVNKENDRPLRLYGAVPLIVEDKSKMLTVNVETKTEVLPASELKINLSNKENKKMYYEVFLVDEGIVRMTGYKLPDPYTFFYSKQAKLVQNFDNFSAIIEKYNDKVMNRLKTGGGDFEEAAPMVMSAKMANYRREDLSQRGSAQRFKNLTIFRGVAESDANGKAELTVKVPNFFGSMRLYVVAVSDEAYGSAEKTISVKAPVIVETTAPRILKIGDKFTVPVLVSPMEKGIGSSEIILTYNGKTYNKKVDVKDGVNEKVLFELESPNKVGTTKIDINFKSAKYNFKESIDFNVDTNYPYQYVENSKFLNAGDEYELPLADYKNFVEGSINSILNISSYQKLGIEKIIKSLMDYPYYCLEQTTSKGKAILYIDKLTDDVADKTDVKNEINVIINKLSSNYQLKNGSFTYWPGQQYENIDMSVYAVDFLFTAKDKGYYVPENTLALAKSYLNSLTMRTNITTEQKVTVLQVLSKIGEANVSEMNIIFDKYYKDLPVVYKWQLLDAYNRIGEKSFAQSEAKKLVKISDKNENNSKAYNNAEILKAYISIFGTVDTELYNSVLTTAKSNEWLSTNDMANIVEALASNKDLSVAKLSLTFKIIVDGKEQNLQLVNGTYVVKNLGLKENAKKIVIKNTSSSKIYIDSFFKGKPIKFDEQDESKNIKITRQFFDLDGKEIDVKNLKVGDRFKIVLTTHIENTDYLSNMALLQILPSGWEFDNSQNQAMGSMNNENLNSNVEMVSTMDINQEMTSIDDGFDSNNFGNYIDYTDMRDDRVAYFYSQSAGEDKTFEIYVNVVTPGTYTLAGTKVEAMYDNNFRAYLKGFSVNVK